MIALTRKNVEFIQDKCKNFIYFKFSKSHTTTKHKCGGGTQLNAVVSERVVKLGVEISNAGCHAYSYNVSSVKTPDLAHMVYKQDVRRSDLQKSNFKPE